MLVTLPALDMVMTANGFTELAGTVVMDGPGVGGLCSTHDRSWLVTLEASLGFVREQFGPFGSAVFGQGTLVDPADVVTAPWRFRVKLRGRGLSDDAMPPKNKHGTKVVDEAVLSLYPGSPQSFVAFDDHGQLGGAEWLGQRYIVLQGGGQVSMWSLDGPGQHAVKRMYTESRLTPEAINASVVINHTLPDNEKNYWYSVVRGVGGRLILGRRETDKEVVFSGRFASAKLLNEP